MHFYGKFYCNASFNVGCYHVTMGVVFHKIAPKSRIWLLSPSVLLLKHSRWASLLIWLFRWPSERTEGPSMRVSDLGTCTGPSQAIRENWRALEVGVQGVQLEETCPFLNKIEINFYYLFSSLHFFLSNFEHFCV